MAKEFKITSLRLADLEKELNYLKTTREREIAAMIAEARSYGDLSENSEYDAAKNEQAKLYGRIAEIEDILSHAVIIEDENEATGRVGLGCSVVVEDVATGEKTTYKITGSQEANPMEYKLSDDSPFGRAVVVGEQTVGKGYFQTTYQLSDGSAVALSVGKYFTPNGVSLAEVGGIAPEIEVPVDDTTAAYIYAGLLEPAEDPQIQAAVAALQEQMAG